MRDAVLYGTCDNVLVCVICDCVRLYAVVLCYMTVLCIAMCCDMR